MNNWTKWTQNGSHDTSKCKNILDKEAEKSITEKATKTEARGSLQNEPVRTMGGRVFG
jgi:hypothetical protein